MIKDRYRGEVPPGKILGQEPLQVLMVICRIRQGVMGDCPNSSESGSHDNISKAPKKFSGLSLCYDFGIAVSSDIPQFHQLAFRLYCKYYHEKWSGRRLRSYRVYIRWVSASRGFGQSVLSLIWYFCVWPSMPLLRHNRYLTMSVRLLNCSAR